MKMLLAALLTLTIMGTGATFAAEAEVKACKAGKVLDTETGKCVTPRGS